jgi:hypothetical protein
MEGLPVHEKPAGLRCCFAADELTGERNMKRIGFKVAVQTLARVALGLLLAATWLGSGSEPAYAQSDGFSVRTSKYVRAGGYVGVGYVVNRLSGRCIDVYGSPGTANGASLQLWDCEYSGKGPGNSPTDQKWELTSDGFIRNKLSGKCIDVQGYPGVYNGSRLQLWDCEYRLASSDQRWSVAR